MGLLELFNLCTATKIKIIMKQIFTKLLPLIACLFTLNAFSQTVTYSNQSDLLQSISGTSYEDCVVDVNVDGYDDVVRITGDGIYIDYQNADGSGFTPFYFANTWQNPPSWSLASGDLNSDGYRDFCFGNGQRVSFVYSSANGSVWTEEALPEYIFCQRSSINDIDLDGDLDAFVCHDVDQSHVYWNDGSGNMTLDISGFETHNGPGNYANMWCDYDNDGDTDFYLTKCRQGGSPGDIDVINQMYRNNGDGTFTEVGAETNTNDPDQSWTTVFEDFDNDGDFDLFTVNHSVENRLQWNNGDGTFSENDVFDAGIDPYSLGAWELDAHDINNDGFVDIISEMSTALYYNDGDGTFTAGSLGFGSVAFGDLNNDGFLDGVRGNTLYMNDGNDNNYVKINLLGIISNSDGIGARVEVHTPDGMSQIREVRSGRSFSPMSNLSANFGIGANTEIEEIIVKWPSGVITVLENPGVNMSFTIPEAECLAEDIEIAATTATTICPGESVEISAPVGGSSYSWSTGDDSSSITVSETGVYSLAMYNDDNCVSISNNVMVTVLEEEVPEISIQGDTFLCEGGSVILTASEAVGYSWSNNQETQSIEITETGEYAVTTSGICYDETSEAVMITVMPNALPNTSNIEAGQGDEITLVGTGDGILTWYGDEDLSDEIGTGTSLTVPGFTLEEETSFWVTNMNVIDGELQSGAKEDLGADDQWGLPSVGGYSLFNSFENFTLLDATVYADGDGERTFSLTDANGTALISETFTLVDGENLVEFNWDIPEGIEMSIRSVETNLFRNDGGITYPYAVGDVASIYTSNFGTAWYYYFYNWHVQKESFVCESEPVEVIASIVGIEEITRVNGIEMFPNPTVENLSITFNSASSEKISIDILNALGQLVISKEITASNTVEQRVELNVSNLDSGVYTVRFTTGGSEVSRTFVKK
ncbi:MAG: hypothetical protein ACI888_001237 [Flavobacteriales bacterium]|jgi:hypothetical protein